VNYLMGCKGFRRIFARIVGALALVGAVACNRTSPTSPTTSTADVGGIWNARITGIQQRTGAVQTDGAQLTLRQTAGDVTGTMQYSGLSSSATLSGSVSNRVFVFTAGQMLSSTCSAAIEATVSLSDAGTEMAGDYRAVTCEDTVIGTLSATRR
jgi:hypothetical protein